MAKATLRTRIKSHSTGENKSGANKLALLVETVLHTHEHGDWSNAALLLSLCAATDKNRIAAIYSAVGMDFVKCTKSSMGLKLKKKDKDNAVDSDDGSNGAVLAALACHVSNGTTFRSNALCEPVGDCVAVLPKAPAKEYDLKAAAKAFAKAAVKNLGNDIDVLAVLIEIDNALKKERE